MSAGASGSAAEPVPVLQVEGLRTGYGDVAVLKDLALEIAPGETVAVLGPNGHGKTTLLRTISGLQRAWAGSVRFRGAEVTGMSAHRVTRIGISHVPQGDLLFPEMTVEENLLTGAFLPSAWRARRRRMDRVWEIFPELVDRRATPAGALSGGERRMCALGRALMREAHLLLIDEPSLGLAPIASDRLYDALARLKRDGLPILVVEEATERVRTLADRVYLLDAGHIVRSGPTGDILADAALLEAYLG